MKALNSRARLAAGIVDTVTIRFATICLSRSKTDGAGPSVYIARTNAGRMLRSFVEQPRSWSRWAKRLGGRFSSHSWKQKRLITKNVVGEIKQLDESGEGTIVFATLNQPDKDNDILLPGAIGEQVVPVMAAHD